MRVVPVLALAGWISLIAGCRQGVDPGPTIELRVTRLDGPTAVIQDGHPAVQCTATLNAVASGDGEAQWMDAVFRWYPAGDTTEANVSTVIPSGTVRRNWGSATIDAETPQRASWDLTSAEPFTVKMEYRLMSDGEWADRTHVFVTCGTPSPSP